MVLPCTYIPLCSVSVREFPKGDKHDFENVWGGYCIVHNAHPYRYWSLKSTRGANRLWVVVPISKSCERIPEERSRSIIARLAGCKHY